jgi:iron(III) transport system ATP-binding protein
VLKISSLVKTFPSASQVVRAVDDVTLDVAAGELLVLLGPSGCGKTTLLRCIAGLESAAGGSIAFGERVVYDSAHQIDVPPNKRNVGMCFQSYALWPHKTVRKNIEYPLKVRRMKRELGWVEEAAALVDCSHLLDRYPGQLSGGQQQRVALARGLVARPELLLFDEPLSNLDALLRNQVRAELHALHGRIGFTGVYVTHDQSEALALGDRLAIMRSGRIEQLGRPTEVYEHPISEYAAHFVGFSNQVVLRRTADGWSTDGGTEVRVNLPLGRDVDEVHVRFRPESAHVMALDSDPNGHIAFHATVVDEVYAGAHDDVTLRCGSQTLSVRRPAGIARFEQGSAVAVHVPLPRLRYFAPDGAALDAGGVASALAR